MIKSPSFALSELITDDLFTCYVYMKWIATIRFILTVVIRNTANGDICQEK